MARVIICDDDEALVNRLIEALRAGNHEADSCNHTMDVLRGVADGLYDVVAINLNMPGFTRNGAIEALNELAPHVIKVAFHERPAEIMRIAARSGVAAVLPRPVSPEAFIYTIEHVLQQSQHDEEFASSSSHHLSLNRKIA
jgi:DNA-binding NtrC family response regulator